MSDKDFGGLRAAEEKFRHRRDWQPQSLAQPMDVLTEENH
jgi:catechol 2,3-dioxygenase